MDRIILAIRLGLRRAWRRLLAFLERKRLTALPPVQTIALLLAVGLIVPLAMGIDRTPASLSLSLAEERLGRLPQGGFPDTSPSDVTYCTEPVFFWKAHKRAKRYRFRLFADDVLTASTGNVTKAHYLLPSPGELAVGRKYRFAVEAYDESGQTLGEVTNTTFSIREPGEKLAKMRAEATRELELADAAYVMAGVYTERYLRRPTGEHGSVHDVRSALARYVALAPASDDTSLARSILGQ